MGERLDWDYIEQKVGKLDYLYKQLPSQRELGKYIAGRIGRKDPISSDAIGIKLRKMGITTKGKGGRHNVGPQKIKSGNPCQRCQKDRGINRFYCDSCHKELSKQVNCDMVF